MRDYSEHLINTRHFLKRAEECLTANNPMGAYHHMMNAFREVEALLDHCLEESKLETNQQT